MVRVKSTVVMLAVAVMIVFASPSSAAITAEMVHRAWEEVVKTAEMELPPLTIADRDVPNAWVTNGRSVTVTTGLMNLLQREEEIFGVLSHEAAHIKLNHYEARVTSSVGIGIAGALLGSVLGGGLVGDLVVGVGSNLANAGISREKEVEADDFAIDIAFEAGRDPTGLYTAMQRISYYGGELQPSGFNSHPPDERRLLRMRNRISERDPSIVFPEVERPREQTGEQKEQTSEQIDEKQDENLDERIQDIYRNRRSGENKG